jgi:hypothetical protein
MWPVWKPNAEYRVREHLIETEAEKLLAALKRSLGCLLGAESLG